MIRRWEVPEGLRVHPDGSWRVGEAHIVHPGGLRYLKSHLVLEAGAAFVADGAQRVPVVVDGPAFQGVRLLLDEAAGEARLALDDGSVETIGEGALAMNRDTGRFECRVRGGAFRALLTRGPHQALLERIEEEGGLFYLRVGARRLGLLT